MMILADKRDYKNGYRKHYVAYNYLKRDNNSRISRCLLLVYSVECGLKCLLLTRWRENSPQKILDNIKDERNGVIKSHNIQKLLLALGQPGFKFPHMSTKHGHNINSETYHQLCRYGIRLQDKDKNNAEAYEEVLLSIAEWIEREI